MEVLVTLQDHSPSSYVLKVKTTFLTLNRKIYENFVITPI